VRGEGDFEGGCGIEIQLGGVIVLVALFSGNGSLPNFE
jgi:hypothetical protein